MRQSTGLVNGVTAQSCWSQTDRACVIPVDMAVHKQVTGIHKPEGRYNPDYHIQMIGGVTLETGRRFFISQAAGIREFDRGNRFFVEGADGRQADVKVFTRFSGGHPVGNRYIATVRI